MTYAPVVSSFTIRVLLSIAVQHNWHIRQAYAVLAFLRSRLHKPVFMRQPVGFEQGSKGTLVCKVRGSLYGLDESANIWYGVITALLQELGFRCSPHDPGLWVS